MSEQASFLACDLGAESGRVMLGTSRHGRLDLREVSRFQNGPLDVGGSLRWDFETLWQHVKAGLSAVASERVASIGVDTWGVDYGLVAADGTLVEPPFHYRDHRTDGMVSRVLDLVGRDRLYDTTGIQCIPVNTIYQLRAAVEQSPSVFDRAEWLLTMPDLINQRLTGRAVCEFTNATTTQCVNAHTRTWAMDVIEAIGVPTRLFGEIVEPGTTVGHVLDNVVPGLAGTPVVAPASHDTGSAVAAVRASGDTAFLSSGTWSLLGTEVPAPVITTRGRDLNFTNEGGVAATTRLLKNIAGLWLLQACRRQWAADGETASYDALVLAARDDARPFRTLIDVDDPSFLNPANMPAAIADYARRTSQPVPQSAPALTRCIFESLALRYREVTGMIEELTGLPIRTIRLVGGGARNTLLAQFTADATGRTVLAGPVEAAALGNVAVQMVATGHAASIDAAREVIERSFPTTRYEPRDTDAWERHAARASQTLPHGRALSQLTKRSRD